MLNDSDFSVSGMRIAAQKMPRGSPGYARRSRTNPVTRAGPRAHGIKISHVVGVKIGSNGSLRVLCCRL